MDAIAREAGVSKATLYAHYKGQVRALRRDESRNTRRRSIRLRSTASLRRRKGTSPRDSSCDSSDDHFALVAAPQCSPSVYLVVLFMVALSD